MKSRYTAVIEVLEGPLLRDNIELALAGLAIVVSVATAAYAGWISRVVSSSDYAVSQRVKSDTARLIAAMRSFQTKFAEIALDGRKMNLDLERRVVNEFLNSPTGFAFYAWTAQKSIEAGKGVRENWRLFFLKLSILTESENANECLKLAVETEQLFDSITKKDIRSIVDHMSDLPAAIANARRGREGHVVLEAYHKIVSEQNADYSEEKNKRRIAFLKELGVNDPDVDLWFAMYQDDLVGLRAALEAGADTTKKIGYVFRKFKKQLQGLPASEHASDPN